MQERGSKALLERLSAHDSVPKEFAEELMGILGDAKPLELSKRGDGVQLVFAAADAGDDDWCGNSTAAILKLRRKRDVPIVIDWFPYGIWDPDLLIGRVRIAENVAARR